MTGDCPQKDNSIPFGGECRDDYLSYTYKQQYIVETHIITLLFFVGIGIFSLFTKNDDGSSVSDINININMFFIFILLALFIDLFVIIFNKCEEHYRLDKNGLYYEHKKLLWRTRKTIPLNMLQNFILNSRVVKGKDADSRQVYYFVNIVTQKKTVKILELTKDKKIIPEWFAFAANTVLANLTGSQPQTQTRSSVSNFKPLDKTFLVPPECKLKKDYLSYIKHDSRCSSILYAILFTVSAIVSIGFYMGYFSISDKEYSSFVWTIIPIYIGFILTSICCYRMKETGSLDSNGFHYKKQSFFTRTKKDIPLNSIQEFRSEKQTNNTRENSNIVKFVEIVVSEDSIRILTDDDNAFREWLVDSGNAVLAYLKDKAMRIQNGETPSDDYIDLDEYNDILDENNDS